MARVNQGYYKEVLKKYEDIKFESEDLGFNYELNSIDDIEVLWSCLERCNDLYNECNSLIVTLEELLQSQKFEMEKTETSYKEIIKDIVSIKRDTISKYKTYKYVFGSQFSDSEVQSINGFEVDKE